MEAVSEVLHGTEKRRGTKKMEEKYQIVTESCSDIRTLARQGLTDQWNTAAITTLLQMLVITFPAIVITYISDSLFTESLLQIYSVLVGAPLMLGYIVVLAKLFRGSQERVSPMEMFNGFEKIFKAVGLYIMVYLKVLAWVFPFAFPGTMMIIANGAGFGNLLFTLLGSILLIAASVLGVIASYRYAMAYYVMADDTQTPIMECINRSKRMMEGNKMKLFLLQLSFIGWMLAILITCGIASFWIKPYMTTAEIAMYDLMTGKMEVDHSEECGLITAQPKQLAKEPITYTGSVKEENSEETSSAEPETEQPADGESFSPGQDIVPEQESDIIQADKSELQAGVTELKKNDPEEYLPKRF